MAASTEQAQVAMVGERLKERHPQVPGERIDALVTEVHAEYSGVAVRDFVAVRAEREAKERLRTPLQPA